MKIDENRFVAEVGEMTNILSEYVLQACDTPEEIEDHFICIASKFLVHSFATDKNTKHIKVRNEDIIGRAMEIASTLIYAMEDINGQTN